MIYLQIKSANILYDSICNYYPQIDTKSLNFTIGKLEIAWNQVHIHILNEVFLVKICTKYENEMNINGNKLCCFVKPFKYDNSSEFQELFGFNNNNFDNNKIIAIEYIFENGIIKKIYN